MRIEQSDLLGTAFLGVFAATNDKVTFLPPNTGEDFVTLAEDVLKTEAVIASVANSSLLGVMTGMNSRCIALPQTVYADEREKFGCCLGTAVLDGFTAVGNMMTANDNGAVLTPLVGEAQAKSIAEAFGVRVERAQVAGLDTPGSCVVATNRGFLSNPNTTKQELKSLQALFGVGGEIGSLNYGSPFVKGCILANSNGAIVGTTSTPFELGRVDDALFFEK